jgi:hypothetical protein
MTTSNRLLALAILPLFTGAASASTAYGDLNNFDVVNDTGTECHGFEIEIEDVHSTDITYTFDWNHYGTPKITEDNSDPAHPKVRVRYEAKYNSTTGMYSAYTAVPAGPIAPTDGHTCTNISVNEGCEHFGVGFSAAPTVVRNYWLVDDVTPGTLKRGAPVNVGTPNFNYLPPAAGQPAQVVAVIQAPPPPEAGDPPPAFPKFGEAVWAKEIKTSSKNDQPVELRDLVSDDPHDPADRNWLNDKPGDGVVVLAEVEIEWRMMQTEFGQANGGANGELAAAPEELPNGDENVTRRYEFFKYAGDLASFDGETGEAMCDKVAPDGLHGVGTVRVTDRNGDSYDYDCGADIVVGDYIGAQMAGFDAEAGLGLIDHLQDASVNEAYVARRLVVGGNTPYAIAITAGALPPGMTLDTATGILSGMPTVLGTYALTLDVLDANGMRVNGQYSLKVIDPLAPDPVPDRTPQISPNVTGALGLSGWYTGNVALSWNVASDTPILSSAGCGAAILKSNTAGVTYTCTATNAQGTSTQSITLKKDSTRPTAKALAKPGDNAAGWNKSAVTVTFSGTDSVSGVASCSAPVSFPNQGTDFAASGTCANNAGLVSLTATASNIDIDLTLPTVSITTPTNGAVYARGSVVTASYVCADALSGVASCVGPIVNGATIDTSTARSNASFIVTAKDAAGNQKKVTYKYSVQ